jgi:hypothetical protein
MNTCIVTAYFKLHQSKANHEQYMKWMQNMLIIDSPMVIFCDESSVSFISALREKSSGKTKIIPMKFQDFYTYQYIKTFITDYNIKDHERYHNPFLYMIWNEKSRFLKKAIELNPFASDYYLWVDIGCFRRPNTQFLHWPNPTKISNLPKDKVILLSVIPFTAAEYSCSSLADIPDFKYVPGRIGGTMFGGTPDTLLRWHDIYYQTIDYFISIDRFIGKDQNIMSTIAVLHKDLVQLVYPEQKCHDIWFYFHEFLQ